MRIIVWFRQDLRVDHHTPLKEALSRKAEIYPLYIFDPNLEGKWAMGEAQRAWLHHSLEALSERIPLTLCHGDTLECLEQVIKKSRATHLFFSRCIEPHARKIEKKIASTFPDLEIQSFNDSYLIDPENLLNLKGAPYQMFTPFYKAALHEVEKKEPSHPKAIEAKALKGISLSSLKLLPSKLSWAKKMLGYWEIGERAAQKKSHQFLEKGLKVYARERDVIAHEGTSKLSPHLHMGELSIYQLYEESKRCEKFRAELFWREFAAYLLYHFPHMCDRPFKEEFNHFQWKMQPKQFKAWTRGETGIPIIDAAMRSLWATGWMHNRARMIVASFLTKNLLIPWQKGAEWFWQTLVDADLANNTIGWQWVAGCGVDPAPFFRIFNPVLQAEKFDPEGDFIRKWVPELKSLPLPALYSPWLFPEMLIGVSYPEPIVDLRQSREQALAAYKKLK